MREVAKQQKSCFGPRRIGCRTIYFSHIYPSLLFVPSLPPKTLTRPLPSLFPLLIWFFSVQNPWRPSESRTERCQFLSLSLWCLSLDVELQRMISPTRMNDLRLDLASFLCSNLQEIYLSWFIYRGIVIFENGLLSKCQFRTSL